MFSPKENSGTEYDDFGFPCILNTQQRRRFRLRKFAAENQWTTKYPTLASALSVLNDSTSLDSEFYDVVLTHGIYSSYRCDIWLNACRKSHPITYDTQIYTSFSQYYTQGILKSINLSSDILRQIELDLPRTFCEQKDFHQALESKQNNPSQGSWDGSRSQAASSAAYATELMTNGALCIPGTGDIHDALRRILRTFCIHHPDTGYLQSMNFLAAFFLLVFGRERESDAYECFETLVLYILPGYYSPEMVPLQADTSIAAALIHQRLPKLANHFERLGLSDITALFLPRWMLCVYLNCFPVDITVRIWDIVILESMNKRGPCVLIETALAILRVCQHDILNSSSFADAVEVLKTLGPRVTDAAELMHLTRHGECTLSSQTIDQWRNQYGGALWSNFVSNTVQPAVPIPKPTETVASAKSVSVSIVPQESTAKVPDVGIQDLRTGTVSLSLDDTNVDEDSPLIDNNHSTVLPSTPSPSFVSPIVSKLNASISSSQGTRTPPVNIDNTLERIFSPLPPSPLHSPSFRSPSTNNYLTSPTTTVYPSTTLLLSPNNNSITSPSDMLRKRAIKASTAKRLSMVSNGTNALLSSPTIHTTTIPSGTNLLIKVPTQSSNSTVASPAPNTLTSPKTVRKTHTSTNTVVNNALKSPLSPKGTFNNSIRSPLGNSSVSTNTSNTMSTSTVSTVKVPSSTIPSASTTVLIDKPSIAAALNATVAAASQRKQQRESSFSASMAAVANGFASAAAAVMKSTLTSIPSSSSVTEQATAAASRLAKAFVSTKAHPTAYTEYDHEANDCELEALTTSMSPKVGSNYKYSALDNNENELPLISKKSNGTSGSINYENGTTPFSTRASSMSTNTFTSPNGRNNGRRHVSTATKLNANGTAMDQPYTPQAVQMMMLSPPRVSTMRV